MGPVVVFVVDGILIVRVDTFWLRDGRLEVLDGCAKSARSPLNLVIRAPEMEVDRYLDRGGIRLRWYHSYMT